MVLQTQKVKSALSTVFSTHPEVLGDHAANEITEDLVSFIYAATELRTWRKEDLTMRGLTRSPRSCGLRRHACLAEHDRIATIAKQIVDSSDSRMSSSSSLPSMPRTPTSSPEPMPAPRRLEAPQPAGATLRMPANLLSQVPSVFVPFDEFCIAAIEDERHELEVCSHASTSAAVCNACSSRDVAHARSLDQDCQDPNCSASGSSTTPTKSKRPAPKTEGQKGSAANERAQRRRTI